MASWTADEDAELVKLANSGAARTDIAEKLDRTLASLEGRASRLGIKLNIASARTSRASQRTVLQHLNAETWLTFAKLGVPARTLLLQRLKENGWIEWRGQGPSFELKLTIAGLDALRAKIPVDLPQSSTVPGM